MGPLEILAEHRPEIEALCEKYGVTRLRLFGSALRPEWNPEKSDFDFLAEFTDPPPGQNLFSQLFSFGVDMEDLLGRKIDIVDWKAVTKPIFREAAEAEAQEWYAA
jgi:uncharacterized protein